jgi:hypothetical protein
VGEEENISHCRGRQKYLRMWGEAENRVLVGLYDTVEDINICPYGRRQRIYHQLLEEAERQCTLQHTVHICQEGRKAENNYQSGETQRIYISHGSWC